MQRASEDEDTAQLGVEGLMYWVYNTTGNYNVAMALSFYLMEQGEHTFEEYLEYLDSTLGDSTSNWLQLAMETDSLRWDCLLEGRFS